LDHKNQVADRFKYDTFYTHLICAQKDSFSPQERLYVSTVLVYVIALSHTDRRNYLTADTLLLFTVPWN